MFDVPKYHGVGGVDNRKTWCQEFKRCLDDVRVGRGEGSEVYYVVGGRYSADCCAIAAYVGTAVKQISPLSRVASGLYRLRLLHILELA